MKKSLMVTTVSFLLCAAGYSQENTVVSLRADTIAAVTSAAPAPKLTGSFEMNYLRHYLWRGMLFGNNDVAQPVLELEYKNFTLALSQNLNYVPKNVPREIYTKEAFFDEQDVEIRYSGTWGRLTNEASALAYFYFYQMATPNTAELSNWTGYNFYRDFSFFTENSVDVANYAGSIYSSNGILFDHTTKHKLQVEWSAYAGFANAAFNGVYFGGAKGGLNLVGSHIDLTKETGRYFFKISLEKDIYVKKEIKEITGIRGVENAGIAVGINF
jgi:hypothetical protein